MPHLQFPIAAISDRGLERTVIIEPLQLPLLAAMATEASIDFGGPIELSLHLTSEGEAIRIRGRLSAVVGMHCSLCLAPFEATIQSDFSVTAIPEPNDPPPGHGGEELELSAEEMEVITYAGDSLDLTEEIAQQIIMALPFTPVCQPDCKGLCSRCGADLNQGACTCRKSTGDSPFAVLQKLNLPPKKE